MVLWSDIDRSLIECVPTGKEPGKFRYRYGTGGSGTSSLLRFQVPRGLSAWGVSSFKSMNVDISNPEFIAWWRELEAQLCPVAEGVSFNSNLKGGQGGSSLRIKVDDATYIFDENTTQVTPEVREGLFRGQELSCLIDIESNYFFNGSWGLTVRASQVKTYGGEAQLNCPADEPETASPAAAFVAGRCAFLPE
jgi:hypothetical protein